jgi:hypothetical protein
MVIGVCWENLSGLGLQNMNHVTNQPRYWNSDNFSMDAYDSCAACKASSSVESFVVAAA